MSLEEQLVALVDKIHDTDSFEDILPEIERDICAFLGAERITIYQKSKSRSKLVSKFKSGDETKEIVVPLTMSSIAGYVALSQQGVCIADVYNDAELAKIHATLKFNRSFDESSGFRTASVITLPIKYKDILLGVLQVVNKKGGGAFGREEARSAARIGKILGQKFRYELKGTDGPYEYLVQTNRIKQEQLDEVQDRAQKEGTSVGELLQSSFGISALELGRSLEMYFQVPFEQYDPHRELPDELIKSINPEYMRKALWVPIAFDGEEVTVLIDDPADAQRLMEVQRAVSAERYSFHVGLKDDILRYLGQGGSVTSQVDLHELVGKLNEEMQEDIVDVQDELDENAATVIQLVNRLITTACEQGASDIHIEPGKRRESAQVRYRIDGVCHPSLTIPASHIAAVVSRIKIMSALDIAERRKPQDGKCVVRYRGNPVELRVATVPTVHGESVVLRVLASSKPLPLDNLNLSDDFYKQVKELTRSPHGIFLVVGPTGSGKTTTLHAVLGELNSPEKKIWTAEDPVEITQAGLQQVQVKPAIDFTFAAALRSFLRADPDIIMIGEMRDAETAHIAIEASLTGHLVLSTLHTNSAPETITRLLDLGMDPVSFSDALLGVLAQRLVRTLCTECKEEYAISEEEVNTLRRFYGEELFHELGIHAGETKIFKAKGCGDCNQSGYKGRTGIHELLTGNPAVKEGIYRQVNAPELRKIGQEHGFRTLMQDGIRKVLEGQTDIEQLRRVAV